MSIWDDSSDKPSTDSRALQNMEMLRDLTRGGEEKFAGMSKYSEFLAALKDGRSTSMAREQVKTLQGLAAGLADVQKSLNGSTDSMRKVMKNLQDSSEATISTTEELGKEFSQMVNKSDDLATTLDTLSKATGRSTTELARHTEKMIASYYAAHQYETGIEDVAKALGKIHALETVSGSKSMWDKWKDGLTKYKTALMGLTATALGTTAAAQTIDASTSAAMQHGGLAPADKEAFRKDVRAMMIEAGLSAGDAATMALEMIRSKAFKPGTEEIREMGFFGRELMRGLGMDAQAAGQYIGIMAKDLKMSNKEIEAVSDHLATMKNNARGTSDLFSEVASSAKEFSHWMSSMQIDQKLGSGAEKQIANAFTRVEAQFQASMKDIYGTSSSFFADRMKEILNPAEVAKASGLLQIDPETLQKWAQTEEGMQKIIQRMGEMRQQGGPQWSEAFVKSLADATGAQAQEALKFNVDFMKKFNELGAAQTTTVKDLSDAAANLTNMLGGLKNMGLGLLSYVGIPMLEYLKDMARWLFHIGMQIGDYIKKHPQLEASLATLGKGIGFVLASLVAISVPLKVLGAFKLLGTIASFVGLSKVIKSVLLPLKLVRAGFGLITGAIRLMGRALLTNPIGLIIAGIAAAVYTVYKNWDRVKEGIQDTWKCLKELDFKGAFKAWFSMMGDLANSLGETIVDAVVGEGTWGKIKKTLTGWVESMADILSGLPARISASMSSGMKSLRDTISGGVAGILEKVPDFLLPKSVLEWRDSHNNAPAPQADKTPTTSPMSTLRPDGFHPPVALAKPVSLMAQQPPLKVEVVPGRNDSSPTEDSMVGLLKKILRVLEDGSKQPAGSAPNVDPKMAPEDLTRLANGLNRHPAAPTPMYSGGH